MPPVVIELIGKSADWLTLTAYKLRPVLKGAAKQLAVASDIYCRQKKTEQMLCFSSSVSGA